MSNLEDPPEVVDFAAVREAMEEAIADYRRLHETSKRGPSLIPNAGIVELIGQTNYLSLGQTLPHQAALMAEWLRKPESQTELIQFIKEQFLDEELRTILQLVLDADFDAKKIILKLLETPSQLSTAQLLYDGYIPILTRSTKEVRAAAIKAYNGHFSPSRIQAWPEMDDGKTARDFLLGYRTAKVALEEYINQCGGIKGVNLLPVPKNNAQLSHLWGQMSGLIERAMLSSNEETLQKMTDLRLLLTMAYIEGNFTTDDTDGDKLPIDGISNGTKAQVDGALAAAPSRSLELEQVLGERLKALVVDPINALPTEKRIIGGRLRTGEEIAEAIPDLEAFLAEVEWQKEEGILLDFLELNEEGQLVMKDDCAEAYGLDENILEARIRQTRVVYRNAEGQTQVITGAEWYEIKEKDGQGKILEIALSDLAKSIDPQSILMRRGLPTLTWVEDDDEYIGEYPRMNTGQLDNDQLTWVEDASLDPSKARYACWAPSRKNLGSLITNPSRRNRNLGSRGVLRVNLNFKS